MTITILESDWKYLKQIQTEMTTTLCSRINEQSKNILNDRTVSDHEKYLKLYKHIEKSDKIVADCFNDWRRSNIWLKIQFLRKYDLLTEAHLNQMSDGLQALIGHYQS